MNFFKKILRKYIIPIGIPVGILIYMFPPEQDKSQKSIHSLIQEETRERTKSESRIQKERNYAPIGEVVKCEDIFDKSKNHIGKKCFDKNRKLHGEYIKKYTNGVTALQGHYNHGKRIGNWWEMSENNNILFSGKFWDDRAEGWIKTYYDKNKNSDSESMRSKCFYIDGKKDGECTEFYIETLVLGERRIKPYKKISHHKQGKSVGKHYTFYRNQTLRTRESYQEGKLLMREEFFPAYRANTVRGSVLNGKGNYTEGRLFRAEIFKKENDYKKNGVEYYFADNTIKIGLAAYKNGKKDGYERRYPSTRNGTQYYTGLVDNRGGKIPILDASSRPYYTAHWKDGKLDGEVQVKDIFNPGEWNKFNGWYKNGKADNSLVGRSRAGTKLFSLFLKEGKFDGLQTVNGSGGFSSSAQYKNGVFVSGKGRGKTDETFKRDLRRILDSNGFFKYYGTDNMGIELSQLFKFIVNKRQLVKQKRPSADKVMTSTSPRSILEEDMLGTPADE